MEPIITSASNPTVKLLRKLIKSGKERHEAHLCVAEGIHLAQSFLSSGRVPKMAVFAESAQRNHEVAELIEEMADTTMQKMVLSDSVFESISSVHASTGILFVINTPELASTSTTPLGESAVLLENIQDPGNLGTILRTAAAVGIKHILFSPDCASPWSPKALRAGMGAQFSLGIYENVDLASTLRSAEIPTIATVLSDESISLYTIDLHRPVIWLFGSEGQGVSKNLASLTTTKATIPQVINTVESLNVATAAAVCLYEQYRQSIS